MLIRYLVSIKWYLPKIILHHQLAKTPELVNVRKLLQVFWFDLEGALHQAEYMIPGCDAQYSLRNGASSNSMHMLIRSGNLADFYKACKNLSHN